MKSRNSDAPPAQQAWLYALRLLAARDYTVSGMAGKLIRKGFAEDDVQAVTCRLEQERWLDDRRYAERFAEAAQASNRYFGQRLKLELRRRGIPSEIIAELSSAGSLECDQLQQIRVVMERRFPGFSFPEADEREKRRVLGFLQRKGFSLTTIWAVLRRTGTE